MLTGRHYGASDIIVGQAMWSGYLNRRGYILRAGIAVALVLGFPYLFSIGWVQLRNSIAHDARGAVQLILFVLLKSGITLIFAAYMLGVIAKRLRFLGSNPWFSVLLSGLYALDAVKFATLGFQAYLMPSFLAPQWSLIALGMMAALAIIKDPESDPSDAEAALSSPPLAQTRQRLPSAQPPEATRTFGKRT